MKQHTLAALALALAVPAHAQFTVTSTYYSSGAAVQADPAETTFPSQGSQGPWTSTSVFATASIDDTYGSEVAHADSSASGAYIEAFGAFALQASSNASTNAGNGFASGKGVADIFFTLSTTQAIELSGSTSGANTRDILEKRSGPNFVGIFTSPSNSVAYDQTIVLTPGSYLVEAMSNSDAGFLDKFVASDSGNTTFYGTLKAQATPEPCTMLVGVAGIGLAFRRRVRANTNR